MKNENNTILHVGRSVAEWREIVYALKAAAYDCPAYGIKEKHAGLLRIARDLEASLPAREEASSTISGQE